MAARNSDTAPKPLGLPRSDEPLKFDFKVRFSDSNDERREALFSQLGLTGQIGLPLYSKFERAVIVSRERFLKSPVWAQFHETILPRLEEHDVIIDSAVCLGVGALYNAASSSDAAEFIQEMAAFLCMIEGIERRQSKKIQVVFQDPRMTSADARLVDVYKAEVVHSPRAREFIGPQTLLFGLHLPYTVVWEFALKEAQPAVLVGNDVLWSRRHVMEDAFLEAQRDGKGLAKVHGMYRQYQHFCRCHDFVVVPVVKVNGRTMFENTTIWYPKPPSGGS
ncbi:hypothetical protein BDV97DRAFT_395099 [Delphinella strobiligena]|nr:hypothetical protein BDV97DRAFT_395099 [Delphinella strobiligena]